jgi:hypothetical protein
VRELCGPAEAQCAAVVFIEGLALWIWFSYMIWHTGFTVKDSVCCVGTFVTLYPVWHDPGSPIVCICTWFDDTSYFYILNSVALFE